MKAKPKVVLGMSGGVDSSLTASLLVDAGYEVIGVTMALSEESRDYTADEDRGCCSLKAVADARRVADIIGIPHYVMNFKELFQKKVIDYFIREYSRGRTPNPCIACNRYIKFAAFMQKAAALGAQYAATGHYARIQRNEQGEYRLYKGVDHKKDQSYVLYNIRAEQLPQFMFPLGGYTKEETRQLAKKLGLPVADKPDSQEICFIPHDDYKSYLRRMNPAALKPGNIVDNTGRVLGHHDGVPLYTIGQRRGLGIAHPRPLYVTALDIKKNLVIVGEGEQLCSKGLIAHDLNWLTFKELTEPLTLKAKIRYGSSEAACVVSPLDSYSVSVTFEEPQRAITPGQSVVFYQDDYVVGGGTIVKVVS